MNNGKEEGCPSNQLVKLDALVERKQEMKTCGSQPGQEVTKHQDYDKGCGEVQTLTTATRYGKSRCTLRNDSYINQ
jgi:hypothetical protein